MIVQLLLIAVFSLEQPSQPPPKPQSQSEPAQAQSPTDPRGTEQSPFVVKVQPSPQTDADAAKIKQQEEDQASDKRWARGLGILGGLVALLQALLIGGQIYVARQQNRIIDTQTEIMRLQERASSSSAIAAKTQTEHMLAGLAETRASNREAGRSAAAMEGIAASLAANVSQLESVMAINRRMADTQERVMVLQNRAYLQTEQWKVFRVIDEFPDHAQLLSNKEAMVRFFIRNKGQSPAVLSSIRKSIHWSEVTIHQLDLVLEPGAWVEQRIPFRIEDDPKDGSLPKMLSEPFTVEVSVDYFDGFTHRTKRFTRRTWEHHSALALSEPKEGEQEWFVYGGSANNSDTEHAITTGDGDPGEQPH